MPAAAAEPAVSRETPAAVLPDRIRAAAAPKGLAIDVDLIEVASNVRTDLGDLEELAASIREHGILEPIIVTELEGGRFLVKTGHRRLAAARLAGVAIVPAVVDERPEIRTAGAERSIEQLIENVQRADLTPLDEARALREVLDGSKGLTQVALAVRLGKSAPWVANKLALLKVDAEVRDRLANGELSEAHVRAIGGLPVAEQRRLAETAVTSGSSAHDLEERAKFYRERAADLAKRDKDSKAAAQRAVEALTAANASTDVAVLLHMPWNLDREIGEKAVQAAGWQTRSGLSSKPGEHCDCRTLSVVVKDGKGSTVERVCTSPSHVQAANEERWREQAERAKREQAERDELGAAIAGAIAEHPIHPTVARLLLREAQGYNGKTWTDYAAMLEADVAKELVQYLVRPGGHYGLKPIPHDKVIAALGYIRQESATTELPSGRKPGGKGPRPQTAPDEAAGDGQDAAPAPVKGRPTLELRKDSVLADELADAVNAAPAGTPA